VLLVANSEMVGGVMKSDLVASFFLGSGLLAHLLRIILASCQCHILTGVFQPFISSEAANIQYITVAMRVLLTNPNVFLAALTSVKNDVISYLCKLHNVPNMECTLTEGVLLNQFVLCALNSYTALDYVPGGLIKQKVWCLALISLYPSMQTAMSQLSTSPDSSSRANNGCIFEAISIGITNAFNKHLNAAPVVKAVAVAVPSSDYVWGSFVTLQQQTAWISDIVKLAEAIVNKVGEMDGVSPRPCNTGCTLLAWSGNATGEERAALKKNAIYGKHLRELIAQNGEDSVALEDMGCGDSDVVPDEEPIFALYQKMMCTNDVAINGNVCEVVWSKLQWLKSSIGEDQYRKLNISCN